MQKLSIEENRALNQHITSFIGYNRELLGCLGLAGKAKTDWPDFSNASHPNVGQQYLDANKEALDVRGGDSRMSPVSCFLDWGYCIWDHPRLETWGLIGDLTRPEWRALDQPRRSFCAHCERTSW